MRHGHIERKITNDYHFLIIIIIQWRLIESIWSADFSWNRDPSSIQIIAWNGSFDNYNANLFTNCI